MRITCWITKDTHTHTHTHTLRICILRSECDGTRWRTGGDLKGKLANGVGSQYSHTTSQRGISTITNADAHTSAASSRLNWLPCRFKWTRPFRRKTKCGFCACAIRFRTSSNTYCISIATMVVRTSLKVRLPYIARLVLNSLAWLIIRQTQFDFLNTFAASYLNTQGLNNSCLKSPASTLVDLTFQSRALRSFSLNQLRNLPL